MTAPSSNPVPSSLRGSSHRRHGFTLTELLVVIGIIVLLLGILLVSLRTVRASSARTQTQAVMTQFINACTAFHAVHERYPGVIDEALLVSDPQITSTENALLHLMGGYRLLLPTDLPGSPAETDYQAYRTAASATNSMREFIWNVPGGTLQLVVDTGKIGEGPVINGKPNPPYFTPGPNDLAKASYPNGGTDPSADATNGIPDLIDAWGQPILYFRQLRTRGPLFPDGSGTASQFLVGGLSPYILSTSLGELQTDQQARSILNTAPDVNAILYKAFVHASLDNQTRGAICLISAGPDGVYFSQTDGPGSESDPIDNSGTITFNDITNGAPRLMDDFDDIRVFGGA